MNTFEWKLKEAKYNKIATLKYNDVVLVEIEYFDNNNCSIWSKPFEYLFQYTPQVESLKELMDYAQGRIKELCKNFVEWSDKKD